MPASLVATEPAAEPRAISYREAVREALAEEMRRDPTVVVFGEDVAAAGGVFKVTDGLLSEFGPLRVRDSPISENALVGAAIGCAVAGLRPVVEVMFADFLANGFDQLVNHAAKLRYMSGGQLGAPMVVRCAHGAGIRFAGQHSQATTSWLLPFPGLKIVAPATPADAKALLVAAIRDPDPVVFVEHKALYGIRGELDTDPGRGRLGMPFVHRKGTDVTAVCLSGTVAVTMAAAEELAAEGVECEVVDLRGLAPLDLTPVLTSLAVSGRLLVVEEEPARGGWGAAIVSQVVQHAWAGLRVAPHVVSAAGSPVPYSPVLEDAYLPRVDTVVAAGRWLVAEAARA
jgi:pyruvate dehydrogenase E1 component beta subunit